MKKNQPCEFLRIPETARLLRTSEETVRRLICKRKLPAVKIGRQWRIHRESLLEQLKPRK